MFVNKAMFVFRCPEDYEIMGEFEYSASKTTALVRFQVGLSANEKTRENVTNQ